MLFSQQFSGVMLRNIYIMYCCISERARNLPHPHVMLK